jgi:hypothetical protein
MRTIFSNPAIWARRAVGTHTRFAILCIAQAVIAALGIVAAVQVGQFVEIELIHGIPGAADVSKCAASLTILLGAVVLPITYLTALRGLLHENERRLKDEQ